MPLLMARIVDIGIPGKDIGYIANIGLIMVALALVAITGGITMMWLTSKGSMGFGANLRDELFEKLQSFSFKNIDQFSTASLVTRLTNDVNNLQQTFMMSLRILMRAPMMLIVSFLLAYSINPELSVVLAVAIPVLVLFVALILKTAVGRFGAMQEKIDAINRVIQENLIGIRVVKSFVRSDYEIQKFQKANDDFTTSAIRALNRCHSKYAGDDVRAQCCHHRRHLAGWEYGDGWNSGNRRIDQLYQLHHADHDERDDDHHGDDHGRARGSQCQTGG